MLLLSVPPGSAAVLLSPGPRRAAAFSACHSTKAAIARSPRVDCANDRPAILLTSAAMSLEFTGGAAGSAIIGVASGLASACGGKPVCARGGSLSPAGGCGGRGDDGRYDGD